MTRLIYHGVLIGILVTIFADSVHWFVTPNSHAASAGRRMLVLIQMVVVLVVAILVWRRAKREAVLAEVEILSRSKQ